MDREFYTISVYVDKDENLIGIPCGESEKYGIADIDTVLVLKAPYTKKQVEDFIEKVFDECYKKKHNDDSPVSTIERYTKKKGFVNATADLTLISLVKTKETYSIMPTFNDFEKGPLCIDDDERLVANVWNDRKGLRDFVELAGMLDSRYQIVLVGLSEAQLRRLPPNITGISKTADTQELAEIYSAADVFINPSREETQGLTTIEALACGTPVITYDQTAVPEAVDKSCGLVMKCGTQYILSALDEVSSDPDACLARAKQYDKQKRFLEYLSLYKSLQAGETQ